LWFLSGIDHHYISWKFSATIAPGSVGQEPAEDFYKQTFPLPVFGLRYLVDLGPTLSFDARVDGSHINHVRHPANEGGPIFTASHLLDLVGTFRWQPSRGFFAEAGYVFNYYSLDETGPEDGNHLLTRRNGPVILLGLHW